MSLSAFDDEASPPTAADVKRVLAGAARHWTRLVAGVTKDHGPIEQRWNFGGARFGWNLRLLSGKRIVLYLTPQAGSCLVGLVLGEKAAAAARSAGLPDQVMALVEAAPRNAEGRGIRMPVRTPEDVDAILRLVALKMGC